MLKYLIMEVEDISLEITEKDDYTILYFKLKSNLDPSILKKISPPKINLRRGLIISGRGPIWLYAYLVHYYHPTPFIAIYDPRIGAVVIQSHIKSINVGDVIDISLDGEG
ncbi:MULTISPECIES: CRISPR-associated ring nuclease Crn3/Csx3 [Dictyoglomus]|jgi:CRISPR-associated protein Csx3|uniref:CRISPR-associated protein, Csx3 family n=1 Tax=Dictyoglomus turgidum (strain DSM 6724 / Z-1310) TaxID=515635 RepID=B8DZG8_DICTD|nr:MULTISPECIES: CRISPR-associated ring nuclease Crn3/Csx3 [Dictyoglomus]ACK41901.1 CRISPR-associated protein, Csx3 family [Dictyoglomus turgidum DSM 6724]PNV79071.1 MAG: CRISPR-associated protein Csx3 [Dictyoglomus turgidum]HBU31245.1 CRISPR-associated protein Csx3 [Dictyoglomus sp.]